MNDAPYPQIEIVNDIGEATASLDVIVVADGFEDRALEVISKAVFNDTCLCILVRYVNEVPGNRENFKRYRNLLWGKLARERVHVVTLESGRPEEFEEKFLAMLNVLPRSAHRFGIDVSGMTSFLTCIVLNCVRHRFPFETQDIFYTAAETYVPQYSEYLDLVSKQGGDEIDYIPKSMALEMSENLILEAFSGYKNHDGKTCLCLFAGYEVHRSSGVIEDINPSLLLLLYGQPGGAGLDWRLDLSRKLHRRFERSRGCAVETVSTLDPYQSLEVLEKYYDYVIDDYDVVIAPVCSKMNTVAAYLFWERYGEVQLTFPLPIGYNPEHRPIGVSASYRVKLQERRLLFRAG